MNRIYNYYWVCVGMLCVLVLTGSALAESRFEKGFREIAWGTHKDKLPDLGLSPEYRERIQALVNAETGSEGVKTETENQWRTEALTIILTDHELIIKSEAFNPDKAASGSIPVGPLQDIPCCPAKG